MTEVCTTPTPATQCPDWCVSHERHGERGTLVHTGERGRFDSLRVTTGDQTTQGVEIYAYRAIAHDGTVLDDGMMLNGTLLDLLQVEAFRASLSAARKEAGQ